MMLDSATPLLSNREIALIAEFPGNIYNFLGHGYVQMHAT